MLAYRLQFQLRQFRFPISLNLSLQARHILYGLQTPGDLGHRLSRGSTTFGPDLRDLEPAHWYISKTREDHVVLLYLAITLRIRRAREDRAGAKANFRAASAGPVDLGGRGRAKGGGDSK